MRYARLHPGTYRAVDEVNLALVRGVFGDRGGQTQASYWTYKPGETFSVPETQQGFWYGLAWHEDFDDGAPRVEEVEAIGV